MLQAPCTLKPTLDLTKPDRAAQVRAIWKASYRQARAQIRTDGRFGLDSRHVHCLDHMRRRFGPAGWPVAQRAARLVLDRRTACRGAIGTVTELQRQGLVDHVGRPVRCVNVERCRSWRIAWSVDPLADINGRRADRAYRVRQRREVARAMAEDRRALAETRFAITPAGRAALREAEAATA